MPIEVGIWLTGASMATVFRRSIDLFDVAISKFQLFKRFSSVDNRNAVVLPLIALALGNNSSFPRFREVKVEAVSFVACCLSKLPFFVAVDD